MGYMRHHTIVVTGWDREDTRKAHNQAVKQFGHLVSQVVDSRLNGYVSFFIAPDGSKEGWSASHNGDDAREYFKSWLRESRNSASWVEVQFADEDGDNRIVDDSGYPGPPPSFLCTDTLREPRRQVSPGGLNKKDAEHGIPSEQD